MNNHGTIILEVPRRHSADLLCNDMVQRAELCQDKNLQPMSRAGPAHLGKEILKRDCLATAQPLQLLLSAILPKTLPGISLKAEPHALPGTGARLSGNALVGVPQSLQVLWAGWAGSKTGPKRNYELYSISVSPWSCQQTWVHWVCLVSCLSYSKSVQV